MRLPSPQVYENFLPSSTLTCPSRFLPASGVAAGKAPAAVGGAAGAACGTSGAPAPTEQMHEE